MTTEALRGTLRNPALISPSNVIRRVGERYSRYLFSPNPPPLNIPREGPTQRDREFVNSSRNAQPQEPKGGITSRDVFLVAGTSISTVGLTLGGQILINRVFGAEPISEPTPASRDIGSVPGGTSFTDDILIDDRLVPRAEAETKKVNPEEIFDNTAEKGIISERNTVEIDVLEYQKIAPPPINKEAPEQFNFLFPIAFPNGLDGRQIEIKRRGDWMGGGKRTIDPIIDPVTQRTVADEGRFVVRNSLTITDGLREGDILVSPASGMIEGLKITGIDESENTFAIMMGGRFELQSIKDIPPSRTDEVTLDNGYKGLRTVTFPVPIEAGEPIGKITKPTKGPLGMGGAGGIGQFQMIMFSTVVAEDETKQIGAVDAKINTSSDSKVYILK